MGERGAFGFPFRRVVSRAWTFPLDESWWRLQRTGVEVADLDRTRRTHDVGSRRNGEVMADLAWLESTRARSGVLPGVESDLGVRQMS